MSVYFVCVCTGVHAHTEVDHASYGAVEEAAAEQKD